MRRLMVDKKIMDLPSIVRHIWYTKNVELEQQVFDKLPKWMAPEDTETDSRRDVKRLIGEAIETLSSREAKVLRLRYWHDLTLEEVGHIFEVTRERIRQIESKALRKLRHPSRVDELRSFAGLTLRASDRVERRQKVWLEPCEEEEIEEETSIALDKRAFEEELLQKYLRYKRNWLNEETRETT